ncbi:AZIN1 inhibitor, partial [Pseudoatta argentina]
MGVQNDITCTRPSAGNPLLRWPGVPRTCVDFFFESNSRSTSCGLRSTLCIAQTDLLYTFKYFIFTFSIMILAIKANSDPTVIQVLAALNACFDCASAQEIKQVMGDRIIFAHPTKYSSHIKYVRKLEIYQMFPCVIRIRCDSKFTSVILGEKFSEETYLIQLTKDLGLNLHGFSFHVDSPGVRCQEFDAYARGIALCKQLVTVSKAIGCDKVQLIDIGGRFPGERGTDIDKFASIINDAKDLKFYCVYYINFIMSHLDFKDIQVVNDSVNDIDVIRDIIKTEKPEDAFYVMDVGDIIKRHQEWISKMPKVVPHYAIKCNSNSTVIKVLAALNAFFDCASKQEIAQVMQYDVQGERIIFAHPNKLPSHIEYSRNVGVERMTVDSEFELTKIKELFPEAKIDSDWNSMFRLKLSHFIIIYNIVLYNSFLCFTFSWFIIALAKLINDAIENLDPDISVISEPGRYYVDSSFTLASYLYSKRLAISDDGKTRRMYYMNCGVYNSFLDELLGLQARVPESVFEPNRDEKFLSNIWGPTADSYDLILKDVLLPEFHIGDWLVWRSMGAYTLTLSNTFNGFPIPTVRPFIGESQWLMSLYLHKRYAIYLKYILNCIVI